MHFLSLFLVFWGFLGLFPGFKNQNLGGFFVGAFCFGAFSLALKAKTFEGPNSRGAAGPRNQSPDPGSKARTPEPRRKLSPDPGSKIRTPEPKSGPGVLGPDPGSGKNWPPLGLAPPLGAYFFGAFSRL